MKTPSRAVKLDGYLTPRLVVRLEVHPFASDSELVRIMRRAEEGDWDDCYVHSSEPSAVFLYKFREFDAKR
jgi:hypothetical protein